jgi:hypothetical protein
MFASTVVERHINQRLWDVAVEIGLHLGMNLQSDVLDLGCGDGSFANTVLARRFRGVDGFYFAEAAIRHAAANATGPNTRITACYITQLDYSRSIVTKSAAWLLLSAKAHHSQFSRRETRVMKPEASGREILTVGGQFLHFSLLFSSESLTSPTCSFLFVTYSSSSSSTQTLRAG